MKLFLALFSLIFAGCARAQTDAPVISNLEKSPLFSYGSWEKKTRAVSGVLQLQLPDGKGGAGDNLELDLSGYSDFSPILKMTIGANNKAKSIRLSLRDDKGGNSTWNYSLENIEAGKSTAIFPVDGAAFSNPNAFDEKQGRADLSKIRQWQIQGNWSGDAIDVSIDEIALSSPIAEIVSARQAAQQRLAAEAEKLRLERIELLKKYARNENSPRVVNVAPVAPDVLAIEIQAGRVIGSALLPYIKQEGDTTREVKRKGDGGINELFLRRGGDEIGWLIGPDRETLVTKEKLEGDPFLTFVADDISNYSISAGAENLKPLAVFRKSKPNNWAQGPGLMAVSHTLYLKLPRVMKPGEKLEINFGEVNVRAGSTLFTHDDAKNRSEAVHVNQIGYRPDDPAKRAFVSCWMGTGGVLPLPETLYFSIIEDKSDKEVWKGKSDNIWRASKVESMAREANFSGTDVAVLDFSSFKTPGKYRISVQGFGSSYPFEISENVWRKAFTVQMRGLYYQRSGSELGPPFTDFKKPRDMHPADGFPVFKTNYRSVESGGENWEEIRKNATAEKMPNAWGGYHDAGDWNPRRVTHMKATMASLEVFQMFPKYFEKLELNIPKTANVPDILTEAMWEFDCFRRLQQSDGGIPYGIESGLGDPAEGEVSWMNSYPSYVFAADYMNSWFYAATGARLSGVLQAYDAKKAGEYRASAIAAFEWAEKDFAREAALGLTQKRSNTWEAIDFRNLAALELYRLTRDKKYHDTFLENTVLKDDAPDLFQWGKAVQREHAFVYASLPPDLGEANLKTKALGALETMAQRALEYSQNNAWNITSADKGKPQFLGFYSTPDASDLTRAHFLTGKSEYLIGAVQATQFQSGANPSNLVYTSGLGANPVTNTFKLDARRTGQKVPEGLTPYGIIDLAKWGEQGWINWPITWFVGKDTTPNAYSWPVNEAYWDVGGWPALNEFTVDIWAPNIQVWGYLAARPTQNVK